MGAICLSRKLSEADRFEILSIGAKLNSEKSLEILLQEIQMSICTFLKAEAASIFIYNEVDDVMNFLSLTGGAKEIIKAINVPMDSIAGTVYTTEESKIINNVKAYSGHFKGTDEKSGFKTENILAVPLKTEKKIGVLEVVNKFEDSFDERDLEAAELISKIISFKIASEYDRKKLYEQMKATIESISTAIDLRDNYTHRHSRNVAELSKRIAELYGLDKTGTDEIEISALLHDIGKIGIKDSVLLKPGKLSEEEYQSIKEHPTIGKRILEGNSVISESILRGIGEHHEKLNGSGYPNKLKGDEIHIYAKIITVADIFDALVNKRVYKDKMDLETVLRIIDSMTPEELDGILVGLLKSIVYE